MRPRIKDAAVCNGISLRRAKVSAGPRLWIVVTSLLISAFVVAGCAGEGRSDCPAEAGLASGELAAEPIGPDAIPSPQSVEEVEARWQTGPHADTFVIDEFGKNSACAYCHSPTSLISVTEEMAQGSPKSASVRLEQTFLIPEGEWEHVGCSVCHEAQGGQIGGEVQWLEIAPEILYTPVDTPTGLCLNCHNGGEGGGHVKVTVSGSHADFDCTACHDAHSMAASCTSGGCHQAFAAECERIQTHDKPHRAVTCSACHDREGLAIGWNEERGKWDSFVEFGRADQRSYSSHSLIVEVDCDRCHAPGNHPWGY